MSTQQQEPQQENELRQHQSQSQDNCAVRFDRVSVSLGGVHILENVSACVPCGESTAIIGPNGAGKTTLLLALLGQVDYRGTIDARCQRCEKHPRIGYVPQRLTFDRGLPLTVLEFMTMGVQRLPLWLGVQARYRQEALDLLVRVRADHLLDRRLGALSGGELQRVLLALALQQRPELLVLDEPAAGIDLHGEMLFCEILERLRGEMGFTQLMVSHDLGTVTHHAGHVICLNRRVVAEGPPHEVLTPETLTAIFGQHMGLVDARAMPEGQTQCSAECCQPSGQCQQDNSPKESGDA